MEAINIIPAVVGATLAGIDKSDQHGFNWPLLCEEYFNRRESENVYLNGPVSSSGHDWWYETMPNVFFYPLNYLYPHTGDFDYQIVTIANRWLEAVQEMGGSATPWREPYMNYRAFRLSTMTPLESGVKQPEAAGAIGWILYQAYSLTGVEKYRIGAEWCLEFLNDWTENPSYELQMPYGAFIAARMNAELGTYYDVGKMVNWCFDRNDQRGWGAIVGAWGENDVYGLIGEVNAGNPDYAFHMNSLEHVGALVPLLRYDDRFATAIGKWVLNVANASRLYYSEFLPDDMQDNSDWTQQFDPESVIAYEALREYPTGPFGTGDAMNGGWAETNLGLYGSSHVGIFGAIIEKTNIDGVLKLDLLATDYYRNEAFSTYLFFNPFDEDKIVEVELPFGEYDIYDAISNQVILSDASELASFEIPSGSSIITVYLPAGVTIEYALNKAYVDATIIDYNTGENVSNYPPRIKSLAANDTLVITNSTITLYCTADDREDPELDYQWLMDEIPMPGTDTMNLLTPADTGLFTVACVVTDNGGLKDSVAIILKAVEKINYPPEIEKIEADSRILDPNETTTVYCTASDANGDDLTYSWSASQGVITGTGNSATYTAPADPSNDYIVCTVMDTDQATVTDSIVVLIRDPEQGQTGDLVAHYEFNGNALDISGNSHHGAVSNCSFVEDQHGRDEKAIFFNLTNSEVTVPYSDELNFRDGITISFWLKINQHYDRESYVISHGNWTTRWKISLGDERLRFTINGTNGVIDIDTESKFEKDTWYHVVGLYNGLDCDIFIDGDLDAYRPYQGQINITGYALIFGQSLPGQSGFDYNGDLDNVRIYDYGISYEKVKEIYEEELSSIGEKNQFVSKINIYPNPATESVYLEFMTQANQSTTLAVTTLTGVTLFNENLQADNTGYVNHQVDLSRFSSGVYILSIRNSTKIVSQLFTIRK